MGTTQPHHQRGKPGDCYWSSARGILHRRRHSLIGEEGLMWAHEGDQIGMDFSNLLLMVKGEWTHTGMDEICFCLTEWRRQGDWWKQRRQTPPPPPPPKLSVRVTPSTHSPKLHIFHGGADAGGVERQQSHAQDVSEKTGPSHPKFFSSWPPSTLGLNCRAEKSLQLWFLLDKMEIAHPGYHGPHVGDTDLLWLVWVAGAKTWPQALV